MYNINNLFLRRTGMKKIYIIYVIIITIFFILLASIFFQNLTVNDYKNDIAQYQTNINYFKKALENSTKNYTASQALLNKTQYELENYQCPEIPEYPKSRIYDVNRDGRINFNDVKIVLNYTNEKHGKISLQISGYNLLYDVNVDSLVDMKDAEEIWANRD